MSECRCDFRGKLLGDGCDICNPAKALEYALETIADQAAELDSLRAKLAAAEARANECGSGAGCLYKDALLAAAEARAERIKSISASAIKTASRDVADWADDMRRIAALAEGGAG